MRGRKVQNPYFPSNLIKCCSLSHYKFCNMHLGWLEIETSEKYLTDFMTGLRVLHFWMNEYFRNANSFQWELLVFSRMKCNAFHKWKKVEPLQIQSVHHMKTQPDRKIYQRKMNSDNRLRLLSQYAKCNNNHISMNQTHKLKMFFYAFSLSMVPLYPLIVLLND